MLEHSSTQVENAELQNQEFFAAESDRYGLFLASLSLSLTLSGFSSGAIR